jgi:zinc/manganese transport system ATP-binding protein
MLGMGTGTWCFGAARAALGDGSCTCGVMVIRFDNLTLGYGNRPAVHHLNGVVERGSLTAVIGPNGAGKSTLLKGLAGVLKPLDGKIHSPKLRRAYLPQASEIDRSFPLPVKDLVAMGLWGQTGLFGALIRPHQDRIEEALHAVGLNGFAQRPIQTLSGGQMQRALFARLLLQDADLILLDEPFTAIDARTTADLVEVIRRWHGENRTIIAVLHDLDMVQRVFPRTLLIAREPICWDETPTALSPTNLLHARRMVEAYDPHAEPCGRNAA